MWRKSHYGMIKRFFVFILLLNLISVIICGASFANESSNVSQSTSSGNSETLLQFSYSFGDNQSVDEYPSYVRGESSSTDLVNQTVNFLDLYDCCSVLIHVSDGHDIIAHRRDSSWPRIIYINDSFKIYGKDAVEQYKTNEGLKDFFHVLITNDGWIIGCGGTSENLQLEDLAAEIMSFGSINYNFLDQAKLILSCMTKGHFVIKSPDNNVGIVITNNNTQTIFEYMYKMSDGDFICCPNDPFYFQEGKYTTINTDPVLAAIYIAGTDKYAQILRRNLMTYDVLRTSGSTLITVYASFDGGTLVNGSGSPDDVMFRDILIYGQTLPKIPGKIKIGEILFHTSKNETKKIGPAIKVSSDTIGMQDSGLPTSILILAIIFTIGGILVNKKT
ncbi:MAG: hypothetical protein LLF83_02415 [Methanobacterium sp.]|nr:hypothetical protein [Methanobacterium sp.]